MDIAKNRDVAIVGIRWKTHIHGLYPMVVILVNPKKNILFNVIILQTKFVIFRYKITNRNLNFCDSESLIKICE